jgi:hypothetical protein
MVLKIPVPLAANYTRRRSRQAWRRRLPGAPFDGEDETCAWVAPVALADETPVVLKLNLSHRERCMRCFGGAGGRYRHPIPFAPCRL